jgi:uncharacterized protein (TIGR02757 family)
MRSTKLSHDDLKALLDQKYRQYNNPAFIENDPVQIPHLFRRKQDIEIAGYLAATIAWGNRKSINANARKLMKWMDDSPWQFVTDHSAKDLNPFRNFAHRTFNGTDCVYFIKALNHIYRNYESMENAFSVPGTSTSLKERILHFRNIFFGMPHPARTEKHVSDPSKKSTAKRICMFLRWMVRADKKGVDFGIWKSIRPSELCLPLDVHTGRVSRQLGILKRTQNDWRAVEEVTASLRELDSADPVKYDFALFGMGVNNEL